MKYPTLILLLIVLPYGARGATDRAEALQADRRFFEDASCSRLKSGLQQTDLDSFQSALLREVAAGLLDGTYDTTYRAASYEAYPSPRALQASLKLGHGFSRYENITGMYLDAGEHVVLVGDTQGRRISLLIPEWMRQPPEGVNPAKDPKGWGLYRQEVRLGEGVNLIDVEKSGNAYVSYFDDHAAASPPVCIHFLTGEVNGYFDVTRDDNAQWDRLLENAVSPIMDARGKHIQVAYPVKWFKEFTGSKGVELLTSYDAMLHHHYTLLGLVKYKKVPANRILARVNFNYYMFRDRDGVAYLGNRGTMRMVADPTVVTKGDACWGFCHEVGHVLQPRPQFTWGGMTEVSCNVFSMYTTKAMGNRSRLAAEGKYASARRNIIAAEGKKSYLECGDVFQRLVPFWQLHLYFARNGRPDFYADVMEKMRRQPDAGGGNESIRNQFEFIKICCDVAQLDLTDFFEKWGFFRLGEFTVTDYGKYEFNVTQAMVDDVRQYVATKGYDKPPHDLTLIED